MAQLLRRTTWTSDRKKTQGKRAVLEPDRSIWPRWDTPLPLTSLTSVQGRRDYWSRIDNRRGSRPRKSTVGREGARPPSPGVPPGIGAHGSGGYRYGTGQSGSERPRVLRSTWKPAQCCTRPQVSGRSSVATLGRSSRLETPIRPSKNQPSGCGLPVQWHPIQ